MTIPEGIQIIYISPGGTSTDITTSVVYSDAYFEGQAAAMPGSFHITVKDPNQTLSFTAGGRIEVTISETKVYGGFVTVPTRDFFFPADDTSTPVKSRRWSLDGVDYNILLDRRILRNTSAYTSAIPKITVASGHCYDRWIIGKFADYFDLDFSGGGTINVTSAKVQHVNDFSVAFVWPEQGSTMRATLDAVVTETTIHGNDACIYWLDADADLNWLALEHTAAPWGFSDIPDPDAVFPFIGWRDGSAFEDGSGVVNDVFIWGGAPISSSGPVVVAHRTNSASISAHGRWQLAEVHPGEPLYKSQAQVDARAKALLDGTQSGTGPVYGSQGIVNPDLQYTLTWFAHDVPIVGGVRQHLVPGMATTLNLWSFSEDGGLTPYSPNPPDVGLQVPLRQMRITFPTLPADNPNNDPLTYVQFEGTFGIQMSDPVWWWQYLRRMRPKPQPAPVVTTNNSSTTFPYGSYFTGETQEAADGARKLFSIKPTYQPGTLKIYFNGTLQSGGYTETNPAAETGGTFTFATAPLATTTIVVECRTG